LNAHPILLQMKYARIVQQFAEEKNLSLDDALNFFYHSVRLIREGVSDLYCMSDAYLVEEFVLEYEGKWNKVSLS